MNFTAGRMNKVTEISLVTLQVITAGFLVLDTSWTVLPYWAMGVVIFAGFLAIWAILIMKVDNLKITPVPGEKARLVTKGPYRLIRHPMYASLFILSVALTVSQFSILKLVAAILLAVDLLVKLGYEERLLMEKFPEYRSYRKGTYRLFPWLF